MIDLYGGDTPNVFKPLIALAELGIAYRRMPVDLANGEQLKPEFLAISPNNRVPVIVDHEPADGGEPISVFESGAILTYLAEKAGALLPTDARIRKTVIEWLMWQMSAQGPMLGQAGYYRNFSGEKVPHSIERYSNEAKRVYRVLDTRLRDREYVAGDFYSIADIACWPWIIFRSFHGPVLEDYPALQRWYHAIEARPAVARALADFELFKPRVYTDEEREVLFRQDGTANR